MEKTWDEFEHLIKSLTDGFNERRRNLALKMFNDIFFFSKKGFKLNFHNKISSAPLSPYYFNFRSAVRIPETRKELALILQPSVKNFAPKRLVDLPESITPLITTISDNTNIPIISVRSEYLKGTRKYYGLDFPINGEYNKREYVMIIDDVCSATASTKFKAIQILRDAGLDPYWAIQVLLDREEGGKEILMEKGYKLLNLFTLSEIMRWYLEVEFITKETHDVTLEYSQKIKKNVLGG